MRGADFFNQLIERLDKFDVEASRRVRDSLDRAGRLARSLKLSVQRFAESLRETSRRARAWVLASPTGRQVADYHARLSRLAQKSPEGTGAVAGLFASIVLALVMVGVGAYRVSLAEAAAEEAKSIASREHPSQLAEVEPAVPAPPADVAPEPKPAPGAAAVTPGPKLPQMGEAFVERFDGDQLDENRWYISDGWSNGDWMENDWRRSQISVTPDGLRLTLERAPSGSGKPLAGAEVQTREAFRYGYFEARMRVPRGDGLITGAFTYARREGRVAPNEIDIEFLGKATRRVELTIHENDRSTSRKVTLPFDSADGFHSYAFDWQPGHVRWYADGVMIHEERGRAAANLTRPQLFLIDQWGTKKLHQWAGRVDPSAGPWMLDVRCVAYAPTYEGKPLCG